MGRLNFIDRFLFQLITSLTKVLTLNNVQKLFKSSFDIKFCDSDKNLLKHK